MTTAPLAAPTKKWRRRLALAFLVLAILSVGLVWFVGGALIAAKPSVVGDIPRDLIGESLSIESKSGSLLAAWHIRAKDPRGVVVLLHPLGFPRKTMLGRVRMLVAAGYACLLFDFQGHGESPGDNVTFGHLEKFDVEAGVARAKSLYPNKPIGVIGWSLGGAAALFASPLEVDALVLEAAYSDIEDAVVNRVGMHLGPLSWLAAQALLLQVEPRLGVDPDDLRPIDFMHKTQCPTFVIGGDADQRTPAAETRAMFEAATGIKEIWLVPDADHIDFHKHAMAEYERRVLAFFGKHMKK